MGWLFWSLCWAASVPVGDRSPLSLSAADRPAVKLIDPDAPKAPVTSPFATTFTDAATDRTGDGVWPRTVSPYGANTVPGDAIRRATVWPRTPSPYNGTGEVSAEAIALGAPSSVWPRSESHYGLNTVPGGTVVRTAEPAVARPAVRRVMFSYLDADRAPAARSASPYALFSYLDGAPPAARRSVTRPVLYTNLD
jgi:hypothetical protein